LVGDQVHVEEPGCIDPAHEFEPLLVAMARHALTDYPAGGDVEGGEQGRSAMALIVMHHGVAASLLQRQAQLSAVQCLDLALFVDREIPAPCPAD
jgi:hypothetical protein